ncbi:MULTISPECIES: acetoacetate--CoA ligase [unclassified Rhodococcus (in: high G+C Gram-positive bacteria)]|uniref:acetoacetate--CoA ligase n=1 Tax=unclassified Rhodococcus (in: high G+C Gram-positive bacteria) TaxID=192944 RepID=UPI0011EFA007|nr:MULTISPECIES: acetoacetate--CoA ligase [unclassified Rhodococcus (in: high G+C Gram-positive bacteria)]KAA0928071.1 acetoacetate--CoA ligase [Rhodococcus sp. ANT_H53B]MDI9925426.1 acetoacetate--CoA ligase [Rhodococcus sp. IEGM 1341]
MTSALWTPTDSDLAEARVTAFARFVEQRHDVLLPDYFALWRWSTTELELFWRAVWDFFEVRSSSVPTTVLAERTMPGAQWFPGTELNYVDHVTRHARPGRAAIVHAREDGSTRTVTWEEMIDQAGALAGTLAGAGVRRGDRVVGYLPNVPEAVIAFLATASLGAVWSACGQDYSASAALDRLGQLEPTALITADGYVYGGKFRDKAADVDAVTAGLPTLRLVVTVGEASGTAVSWSAATAQSRELEPAAVPFDHPLWVVFSSGTTGLPKGIVHGHGGVVLEHLKSVALHSDLGPEDVFFWYTSPSWMMWNFQVAGLLAGSTIVCADGNPAFPTPDALWDIAARLGVTYLGTSPGYVLACIKADAHPGTDHDLSALRAIGITGSAMPATSSIWLSENIGAHVPVFSISGGTDVVSAFAGGVRTAPVRAGELSVPFLGVALDAYDEDGEPVRGTVGELVVTEPMPSMPLHFWNDADGSRYREAYFETYPGIWRHGDWITRTDRGSVLVHGRSDSTLNRNGIRMGSADIYQAVESLDEVTEALVLGIELPDGGYWMPLFVVVPGGATDELGERIRSVIGTQVSPRHVPDDVIATPAVPHTRTGKKLEVPLKRLFQGAAAAGTVDASAVDDPAALAWFVDRAAEFQRVQRAR